MTITEMDPQIAMAMELIRGLLDLSRMVDNNRTAKEHRRAVIAALPCIAGVDALFQGDLIDAVFEQEASHG